MRAVDHEVGSHPVGLAVDLLDRLGQRLPARQSAVRLNGEGDHNRHPDSRRRTNDPDRLFDVGHREPRDQIGSRVGQDSDLPRMECL